MNGAAGARPLDIIMKLVICQCSVCAGNVSLWQQSKQSNPVLWRLAQEARFQPRALSGIQLVNGTKSTLH